MRYNVKIEIKATMDPKPALERFDNMMVYFEEIREAYRKDPEDFRARMKQIDEDEIDV